MLFSRQSEYAIRALTYLARQPEGQRSGAETISKAEKIPAPFLWKILHTLAKRRLIRSFKGVRGGYELALPAAAISLSMIVGATDGLEVTTGCVLGLPQCGDENSCPMHETWKEMRAKVNSMLEKNTLADLAQSQTREA